jgi:threonine/homoserine/homoserine lactone efflux protein
VGRSLLAFAAFAAVLTLTPGVDTFLVLRTTASRGREAGFAAAVGVGIGCLCWALASALGITALLAASEVAYEALRWAGVGYLCWLGVRALRRSVPSTVDNEVGPDACAAAQPARAWAALGTGLTTNLLNPKVGAFYLSVLPQFLPGGVSPLLASTALAGVHVAEGLLWMTVVIVAVGRSRRWLTRPTVGRRLEQLSGVVFVAFGVKLAAEGLRR